MLVLTRKSGEEIVIGDGGIRLTVLDVGRNRVQLGISAPTSIRITRAELLEQVLPADTTPPTLSEAAGSLAACP